MTPWGAHGGGEDGCDGDKDELKVAEDCRVVMHSTRLGTPEGWIS